MKTLTNLFLTTCTFLLIQSATAQNKSNVALAKKIDSLMAVDQAPAKLPSDQAPAAFKAAIHSNFPLVKAILDKYGFPSYQLVGQESAHHYWILVQHSDFDVDFQKRALRAMKKQLDKKNASGQDYAYLIDRIALNEKRPQVYGTQVNMGPGGTKLKPTIDTANLDKRRLSVGLTPIKAYLKRNDEIYQALNNGTLDQLQAKYDSLEKVNPKKNR